MEGEKPQQKKVLLHPRKGLRKASNFTNISQLLNQVSYCCIFLRRLGIIRIRHGTWRCVGGCHIPFDILKKQSPGLDKTHGSKNWGLCSFRALMTEEVSASEEGNGPPCLYLSPAEHSRVPAGAHGSSLPAQAPTFPSSGNQVIGKMVCMYPPALPSAGGCCLLESRSWREGKI